MTYEIFEGNMERLRKKLTTIRNKCAKYGCEFTFEEQGEIFREVKDEDTGRQYTAKFIQVETSGIARISDWEFVATIEHAQPYNIIRSFREDITVPEHYYTADTCCDHCKTRRTRKDTYIIRNTQTGEFKQVGKSCLLDFTNGLSAEGVAQYISWFNNIISGQAPVPGFKTYYNVTDVLAFAVEAVKMYGYRPSDWQESTKEVTVQQLKRFGGFEKREADGFNGDRPENYTKAEAIQKFVVDMPVEFGYVTSLKAACSKVFCEWRDLGFIVSAVSCYNKAQERGAKRAAEKKAAKKSSWVGTVGQRMQLNNLSVRLLTSWDGEFGYTYLYKFIDEQGNIFTWKTGKWVSDTDEIAEDLRVSLKGTIKNHSEYKGEKQTELTRCSII